MDELMDMIAADDSASQVSDKIKDILYAKSADEIEAEVDAAAAVIAGQPEAEAEVETEVEDESEE
jgi:hypothetical protein